MTSKKRQFGKILEIFQLSPSNYRSAEHLDRCTTMRDIAFFMSVSWCDVLDFDALDGQMADTGKKRKEM
jgi:hypothetical protein